MKNAAAPAELPRVYLWNFPGAPIRIHLRLAAVSKIRDYLLQGVDQDPTNAGREEACCSVQFVRIMSTSLTSSPSGPTGQSAISCCPALRKNFSG